MSDNGRPEIKPVGERGREIILEALDEVAATVKETDDIRAFAVVMVTSRGVHKTYRTAQGLPATALVGALHIAANEIGAV